MFTNENTLSFYLLLRDGITLFEVVRKFVSNEFYKEFI